jgi:hypothetical protein
VKSFIRALLLGLTEKVQRVALRICRKIKTNKIQILMRTVYGTSSESQVQVASSLSDQDLQGDLIILVPLKILLLTESKIAK